MNITLANYPYEIDSAPGNNFVVRNRKTDQQITMARDEFQHHFRSGDFMGESFIGTAPEKSVARACAEALGEEN